MRQLFTLLLAASILYGCTSEQNENTETESTTDSVIIESDVKESNIIGEEVSYSADGVEMKGYMVYDASITEPKPGILVVHEWWGHNDHARNKATALAEMGYVALAVDMYGDGKQAMHPEDAEKFAGMVMSNLEGAEARFGAAYDLLKNNDKTDPEKMGAIGFCFGGSVVLTMANTGMDLDAVAAFHSGVQLPVMPSEELKAKVLVCNGEADPMVTAEQAENFKSALDAAGADYEYVSYPDVVHAFTNPGADTMGAKFELPLAYNKEADEDSWQKMKELFENTF
jgi:dienelactone hydrolase